MRLAPLGLRRRVLTVEGVERVDALAGFDEVGMDAVGEAPAAIPMASCGRSRRNFRSGGCMCEYPEHAPDITELAR